MTQQLSLDDLQSTGAPKQIERPTAHLDIKLVALDPLLTAQQIIEHSGLGYHTLLREFRSGRLPALKVAGQWRVELRAYREWLERQRYVPRGALDTASAPMPRSRSRSTSPVGSLVRLRAIEEQEAR